MYRSHWNRPRPAYAAVVGGSSNSNDRGSMPGDDENTVEANNQRVLLLERDDRLNTAGRRQSAFLNKIHLELCGWGLSLDSITLLILDSRSNS